MKKFTKVPRYTVGDNWGAVWIYDNRLISKGGHIRGFVMRFGVLGDGRGCMHTVGEAKRLARKVCRFLNKETP